MSDIKKSIKSNLYWNTLIRIPSQLINFVLSILIARILMPDDYGILGIGMMVIGYANMFTNLGLNNAIVQQQIIKKDIINSIFSIDIIISIVLTFLLLFVSKYIAGFFNAPSSYHAIQVLSIVFIITSIEGIPQALLRRDSNFKVLAIFEILKSLSMSILTLILAINLLSYWALIFGQIIPLIFISIAMCIKTKWMPQIKYKHSLMKPVFNFGIWNFFRSQLEYIVNHADKIIVGKFLGVNNLGIYDKSVSIAMYPVNSIFLNINSVLFSSFSKKKYDRKEVSKLFVNAITITALVSIPLYAGLLSISSIFVKGLLGENWVDMIIPFQIILSAVMFKSFSGMLTSLNIGIGIYKKHTNYFLLSTIIFILLCFLLLDFGLIGISLAFFIFNIVQVIFALRLSLKEIKLLKRKLFLAVMPSIKGTLLMIIVLKIIQNILPIESDFFNLMFLVIIGAMIYTLFIYFERSLALREIKIMIVNDIKKVLFS